MDVLVFVPVLRLQPETVMRIFELEHDGPMSIMLQRDNPTGNGHDDHYHQYVRGRELFLNGRFDAMLVVENDILPPADALTRLQAVDADVAYGCYMFRSGVVNVLERYKQPARNMGESLTVRGLWQAAKKQGVIECSGAGLGCTLIKRHVLEAVPFSPPSPAHCDWKWTEDVYRAGYSMVADTMVLCGHQLEEGVLWPT
jgi:hypothetical protein